MDYLDKKFLLRLSKIASSASPKDCLKEYNKNASASDSEQFWHLLLECFSHWGGMFKETNRNYLKYAQELSIKGRLPVANKYWDFPNNTYGAPANDRSLDDNQLPGFAPRDNLSPINTSNLSGNHVPRDAYPANDGNISRSNPPAQAPNQRRVAEIGRFIRGDDQRPAADRRDVC